MLEGLFRRPPEDEAIPVLTEIIVPTEIGALPVDRDAPEQQPMPLSEAIAAAAARRALAEPQPQAEPQSPSPAGSNPSTGPLTEPGAVPGTQTLPFMPGLPPNATQRLAILADRDLVQFEEQLRESVLTRLHPRIDPLIHQRLDAAIRDVIDAELPQLRERIATALTQTLNDVVARAISKELAKIHASRKP